MNEISTIIAKSLPRERVITALVLFRPPKDVWQCLMFYEDVPRRPSSLLRWVLPQPVRSEGDKQHVGSLVRCTYDRGHLVKRITRVEPPVLLRFEVLEQRLGIEHFAVACEGSYELEAAPGGTLLTLTTIYRPGARPRWVFRPLERYLCHRLHRHVLWGMRERLATGVDETRLLRASAEPNAGAPAAPTH
jgi:hypothetical protein